MSKKYEVIPTAPLAACTVAHPPLYPDVIHEDDPALHVLVDYTQRRAPLISAEASLDKAADTLKTYGVRTLLVEDSAGHVIGIVLSSDVYGQKPYQIIQDDRITRADIKVKQLMTPIEQILAVKYHDIRHANVGNIIRTLSDTQQPVLLVEEEEPISKKSVIRGTFSASRISRALGEDITDTMPYAKSILDLQRDSEL